MVHYSVILPIRDCATELARQIPHLATVVARLGSYELIVIDDGSAPAERARLEELAADVAELRLLHWNRPQGYSRSLAAGIAAAQGETLITLPLSGNHIAEQIPLLLERLARADLVYGCRQVPQSSRLWRRMRQLPWSWLFGPQAQDPDSRFWVARAEALAGIQLPSGAHRYLPHLVTLRGYRVSEAAISHQPPESTMRLTGERSLPLDLLATWWLARRSTATTPAEYSVAPSATGPRHLRIDSAQTLAGPQGEAPLAHRRSA